MSTLANAQASHDAPRSSLPIALLLLVGMAVTVGTAVGFQYIGGYLPCKLCYEQRIPYYTGIPVMVVAIVASLIRLPGWISRLLLAVGGLLMVWGLYMAVYHAGVEWQWWAGPTDCGFVDLPPSTDGSGGVLDVINTVIPPSCDKAALRILGLSFAGWNVIASLVLGGIAFYGAARKR